MEIFDRLKKLSDEQVLILTKKYINIEKYSDWETFSETKLNEKNGEDFIRAVVAAAILLTDRPKNNLLQIYEINEKFGKYKKENEIIMSLANYFDDGRHVWKDSENGVTEIEREYNEKIENAEIAVDTKREFNKISKMEIKPFLTDEVLEKLKKLNGSQIIPVLYRWNSFSKDKKGVWELNENLGAFSTGHIAGPLFSEDVSLYQLKDAKTHVTLFENPFVTVKPYISALALVYGKDEAKKYIQELNADEYNDKIYLETKRAEDYAVSNIEKWTEEGKPMIYPKKHKDWSGWVKNCALGSHTASK